MLSESLSARIVNVIVEFMDNDKGYVAWLAEHPDGFVLNCDRQPRPSYRNHSRPRSAAWVRHLEHTRACDLGIREITLMLLDFGTCRMTIGTARSSRCSPRTRCCGKRSRRSEKTTVHSLAKSGD